MKTRNLKKDGTPDRRYYPNHVRKKKRKQIIHGICQCKSCKAIREKHGKGSLIYMDPPYHWVSNLYGTKAWKEIDFVKLRNHFHYLNCVGFKVILSMSDTPFIRELFVGYNIKSLESVSGLSRKKVKELIITSYNDLQLRKVIKGKIK